MADAPHLSDLFKKGETVTITDQDGNEYKIFVTRPASNQQQVALDAANARSASYTIQYENKAGDRYEAIAAAVKSVGEKDDLVEQILMYHETDLRQQAYQDVLHDEDVGSQWSGTDTEDYVDILNAITSRWEEIKRYNENIDEDDRIDPEDDEILTALTDKQAVFQDEVEERAQVLFAEERNRHVNKPVAQLQNELIKKGIEIEAKLYWYEEYQTKMLYYACRYDDDHEAIYFDAAYDVLELPQYIREELYRAYERLELGSEEVKNSLSLPTS